MFYYTEQYCFLFPHLDPSGIPLGTVHPAPMRTAEIEIAKMKQLSLPLAAHGPRVVPGGLEKARSAR